MLRENIGNLRHTRFREAYQLCVRSLFAIVLCVGVLQHCRVGVAQVTRPQIHSVTPHAIAPDRPTDITIDGTNLQHARTLLSDVPLYPKLLEATASKVRFRVAPRSPAVPGIHQLRLVTPRTISPPRLWFLETLPLFEQRTKNHSTEAARELNLPASVSGWTTRGKVDYYRFTVKQSTDVSIEVFARRIGVGPNRLLNGDEAGRYLTIDPVVRLIDPDGRTVADVDDAPGVISDLRFRRTLDRPGDYHVLIHDVRYHGGPRFPYVLRIGDFPLAQVAYPNSGSPSHARESVLHESRTGRSWNARLLESATAAPDGLLWLQPDGTDNRHAVPTFFAQTEFPPVFEQEPDDDWESAPEVKLPVALHGRIESSTDVDCVILPLTKGEAVRITPVGRSLGSPVQIALELFDDAQKRVASTLEDGSPQPEGRDYDPRVDMPSLTFQTVQTGRHQLRIRRRLGEAGVASNYSVLIEREPGNVSLDVSDDVVIVPLGGRVVVPVSVKGPVAPIELTGVSSSPPVVPTTVESVRPFLMLRADEGAGGSSWLTVHGRVGAHRLDADIGHLYDAPKNLAPNQGHFYYLRPLPMVVRRRLAVLVSEPAPFVLNASRELVAKAGQPVAVRIQCERKNGFTQAIALNVDGLPFPATAPMIAADATQVEFSINVPADTAAGDYAFAVTGQRTSGRPFRNATRPIQLVITTANAPAQESKP